MDHKQYIKVTGYLFLIICLAHLWRILNNVPISINHVAIPISVSWFAILILGYLSYQGLRKK